MKPLHLAKQRLRPAIPDETRIHLATAMLRHVLATVTASGVADQGIVISADWEILAVADDYDLDSLHEIDRGYNCAVRPSDCL